MPNFRRKQTRASAAPWRIAATPDYADVQTNRLYSNLHAEQACLGVWMARTMRNPAEPPVGGRGGVHAAVGARMRATATPAATACVRVCMRAALCLALALGAHAGCSTNIAVPTTYSRGVAQTMACTIASTEYVTDVTSTVTNPSRYSWEFRYYASATCDTSGTAVRTYVPPTPLPTSVSDTWLHGTAPPTISGTKICNALYCRNTLGCGGLRCCQCPLPASRYPPPVVIDTLPTRFPPTNAASATGTLTVTTRSFVTMTAGSTYQDSAPRRVTHIYRYYVSRTDVSWTVTLTAVSGDPDLFIAMSASNVYSGYATLQSGGAGSDSATFTTSSLGASAGSYIYVRLQRSQ